MNLFPLLNAIFSVLNCFEMRGSANILCIYSRTFSFKSNFYLQNYHIEKKNPSNYTYSYFLVGKIINIKMYKLVLSALEGGMGGVIRG